MRHRASRHFVCLPMSPDCSSHISSRCVWRNFKFWLRRLSSRTDCSSTDPAGCTKKHKHTALVIPFKVSYNERLMMVLLAFSERDAVYRRESHQRYSDGSTSYQAGSHRNTNDHRPIMSSYATFSFRHLLRIFTSSSLTKLCTSTHSGTILSSNMIKSCSATMIFIARFTWFKT
jgi:hypothetical protein